MISRTPIPSLCSVGHQEADEGEIKQKRGQRWKCEAGMSDWKQDDHEHLYTNCGIFSRISWHKKQGVTTYKVVHAWGLWMSETDVAENPNHEKKARLKAIWVSLSGIPITKENQKLCGKYQVRLILLVHNRSWLRIDDMQDRSSQYIGFGLQLAWASSLNILTMYMVQRSRKNNYSTNVCFLDCESLNELQPAIHSFNTSADIFIQIRFYTWKQTLFLFPYLFWACFCFCSFISYVTDSATWTSSYLWDPSSSKQTFVVCA